MNYIKLKRHSGDTVKIMRINMNNVLRYYLYDEDKNNTMIVFGSSNDNLVVINSPEEIDKMIGLDSDFEFGIS